MYKVTINLSFLTNTLSININTTVIVLTTLAAVETGLYTLYTTQHDF